MDKHSFEKSFSDDIQKVKRLQRTGPTDEWLSRTRSELLQHMIENPPRQSSHYGFRFRFATLTTVLLVAVGLTGGVGFAAQNSLPDDQLYPIKRATEQIQVLLTPQAEEKSKLKIKLAQRRQEEAQTLIHLKPERVAENPGSVVAVLNESKQVIEEELARLKGEISDLKAQRDAIASEVESSLAIASSQENVEHVETVAIEEIDPAEHIGGGVLATSTPDEVVEEAELALSEERSEEVEKKEKETIKTAEIETTFKDKSIPKEVKDALVSSELVQDELKEVLEEVEELKNTDPVPQEEPTEEEQADPSVDEKDIEDPVVEESEQVEIATSTEEIAEDTVEERNEGSEN